MIQVSSPIETWIWRWRDLPQAFLGADGESLGVPHSGWPAWRQSMRVVELVIHYKYNTTRRRGRTTTVRTDYDIALLRIDYPVIDEESGEKTFLKGSVK